ncbi:hypothetical protein MUO69_07145 [Candidatus Bathyarchaeota archaeon]|jgi:hypothetical protein|nr:hypothetical protein [Candidatus Bathyarchaeota archaeon]
MSAKRFSIIFLIVGGLVLGVLGLFLPWAEWSWIRGYMEWSPVLGINIPLGVLSFVGWLIAVLSLVLFKVRKQELLLVLPMVGGIIIMICAFAGIVNPGTLFGMRLSGGFVYRASYGVYVSLIGGALTFAGAALAL